MESHLGACISLISLTPPPPLPCLHLSPPTCPHEPPHTSSRWVWDMAAGELCAVLQHSADVSDVRWAPQVDEGAGGGEAGVAGEHEVSAPPLLPPPPVQGCLLATVTSGNRLYMWSPAGASVVHIPLKGFQVGGGGGGGCWCGGASVVHIPLKGFQVWRGGEVQAHHEPLHRQAGRMTVFLCIIPNAGPS